MSVRLWFYQTRSAWSMDQGSTIKRSTVHNFAPAVTKFCVMWEGLSLPRDTKFGNCMGEIVDRRIIFIWSLIHGSGWSRLIKAEPGDMLLTWYKSTLWSWRHIWYEIFHNCRCRLNDVSNRMWTYSISQEICTRFCCALLCCGYAIVHNEFIWSIYPYWSGLLCWHWGNR